MIINIDTSDLNFTEAERDFLLALLESEPKKKAPKAEVTEESTEEAPKVEVTEEAAEEAPKAEDAEVTEEVMAEVMSLARATIQSGKKVLLKEALNNAGVSRVSEITKASEAEQIIRSLSK